MTSSLLNRYQAGEHREVWAEIRRLGPVPSSARDEVEAVATETMRRVAGHVRRLAEAYAGLGFVISDAEIPLYRPATPADVEDLDDLASELGDLPVALRACLTEVGELWLAGDSAVLGLTYHADVREMGLPEDVSPDPLCLPGIEWLRESWEEHQDEDPDEPFFFEFAPDELHKANVSGAAQEIELPSSVADPVLDGVPHARKVTLVDYLRKSIAWGGCPGWAAAPDRMPAALAALRVEPDF
jgi:hypothetical protein